MMTQSQIELARLLREVGSEEDDWDYSAWVLDSGKIGIAHVYVQDFRLDYSSLVDENDFTWTHIPNLDNPATEGVLMEMLRATEGYDGVYSYPVLYRTEDSTLEKRWQVFRLTSDTRIHEVVGPAADRGNPRKLVYPTSVEAIGHALLYVRGLAAASRAAARVAGES